MSPRRWLGSLIVVAVLGVLIGGDAAGENRCTGQARQIFRGVVYGCQKLAMTDEGGGAIHWVRVDLAAPGIGLYVTPLDPGALAQGRQYRLRWIASVTESEQLAVAINACMFDWHFGSRPRWWPGLPGDLANTVETVVANHIIAPASFNTSWLWFDDALVPHMIQVMSARPLSDLDQAKWAISGGEVLLHNGVVRPATDRSPDSRTAVAVDQQRKLLFLAVGGWISPRRVFEFLANLGAKDGMLLDGGTSSAMAIGRGATGIAAGAVYGGWRPVATYFGVKAEPVWAAGLNSSGGGLADPLAAPLAALRERHFAGSRVAPPPWLR